MMVYNSANPTELSTLSMVLPSLEQSTVYNTINFDLKYSAPSNSTALMTVVNGYSVSAVDGSAWLCGQHIYLHATPPNTRSCGFFPTFARSCPPRAAIQAESIRALPMARSNSLKTRSTSRPGVPWAPSPVARL